MKFDPPVAIDYARYRALKLSLVKGIMTVTLSNPGRKNAASPRTGDALGRSLGGCSGAGLASDMVSASATARFCDSHVKVGLVAGNGGVLLWPAAVGIHRAKGYLMTGRPVPAKVAEEIGLINRCIPDEELDAYVQQIAEELAALPPHAVNYTKASINLALKQMTGNAFETSLAYEIYLMGDGRCLRGDRGVHAEAEGSLHR